MFLQKCDNIVHFDPVCCCLPSKTLCVITKHEQHQLITCHLYRVSELNLFRFIQLPIIEHVPVRKNQSEEVGNAKVINIYLYSENGNNFETNLSFQFNQ